MPSMSPHAAFRQWRTHLATDIDRLRGFPELRKKFKSINGYDLNLDDPKTLNEKIQWRKVYDKNPLFPVLLDKVRMGDWARSKLPAEDHANLPVFLQVAQSADEIDFSALPENLALKCNHASGWNILLRAGDPYDPIAVRQRLDRWLARKFGKTPVLHEYGYLSIPPRIAVQALLQKADGSMADDIRFHMFGDRPGFLRFESFESGTTRPRTYLDENWQPLDVDSSVPRHAEVPKKPDEFDAMLRIAKRLGHELDYLRIDFLSAWNAFFLNELTLFNGSGFSTFQPQSFERNLGAMWTLPNRA